VTWKHPGFDEVKYEQKEGECPLSIRVASRTRTTAVDVFVEGCGVGSIYVQTPKHISKKPKWMSIYIPPECFIGKCPNKCPNTCSRKITYSACGSPEEALGLMLEEMSPDMVVDFKAIDWPADFYAGVDALHKGKKSKKKATVESTQSFNWETPTPQPKVETKEKKKVVRGKGKKARLSIDQAIKDANTALKRHGKAGTDSK
jgi:hypothetical protein